MVKIEELFILGINMPLPILLISSWAEESGTVIPIPTLCENEKYETLNRRTTMGKICFITFSFYNCIFMRNRK